MMTEVREGFLCPICMADLGDDIQLAVHFDEKHSREDPAIVQNFKELFSKAKKIINKDQTPISTPNAHAAVPEQPENDFSSREFFGPEPSLYHPVSGIHYDLLDQNESKAQLIDKFDQFRLERAKRADIRAMDINKLIVRLEKLMNQLPSDPVKRRNHEQSIVPWINEKDVALCPGCAKSFGITRRKHHCRLCGGVMCAECSDLVSFELAERLVNPATLSKFNQSSDDQTKTSPSKSRAQATYDGLVSNLVDLAGFAEAQRHFRSCLFCKEVLDKRDHRLSIQTAPEPDLVKYYTHLQKLLSQGEEMSQKYRKMAASLHNGESTYQIDEVKILRLQVLKAAETVEAVSKKIAALPPEDAKTETLQNRIRISAVNFVKETLVGLPSAPTQEEFEEIKKQKARDAAKRIEEEKRSAHEAKIKSESMKKHQNFNQSISQAQSMISNAVSTSRRQLKFSNNDTKKGVKMVGQGFVATAGQETIDDDPLGQQIYNLKKFIQQAKAAGQYDDARILENNLKDITEEYRRQKTDEQFELQQNYQQFKDLFSSKSTENSSEELDESNPFYDAQEEQLSGEESDYDKSGKNPFA